MATIASKIFRHDNFEVRKHLERIMIPLAFSAPGQFWRGNLHCHSTRSDGVLDPEEVCHRYREEGYDFLCLSDHFTGQFDYPITDTSGFRTKAFTTLIGAELHSGAMQNGDLWHILAVGLPQDFARPDAPDFRAHPGQESGPDIARRARDAGAFVVMAHPQWSGLTLDDALSMDAAHAVEAYNYECEVSSQRGDGFHMADLMLSEGRQITLTASDDAHFKLDDHFGGWVRVKAKDNTPDALLSALKSGAYYSSQGPDLHHIELRGAKLVVHCSDAVTIIVQGRGSATRAVHAERLTSAELPVERFRSGGWLRVTVVDDKGRKAWSNPIWL